MSNPVDLVEFLRARLDEDEAAAKAATDGPWSCEVINRGTGRAEWIVTGHTHQLAVITGEVGVGWMAGLPHDGEHIARHDPARVLREVEAKRAILAEHQRVRRALGPDLLGPLRRVLRQLAAVYGDHPDYREEWKP